MQKKAVLYDKGGDKHYDYISAWIKATRGSDVDASLYYLAVMLEGGEDPRFIARRMIVLASEDIGNADPAGAAGRSRGGARRRARRHAGVRAEPEPGRRLPGARAEVERELHGDLSCPRRRARARRGAAAAIPPGRALPRRAQAGARRRLRVSARPARRSVRPAAAARGPGGPHATTSRPTAASRRSSRKGLQCCGKGCARPALSLYSVQRQMGSFRLRQGPQPQRLAGISWRTTVLGLVLGFVLLGAAPSAASAAADLSVTVCTATPEPVLVGQHLTYTITVQNLGADPATAVGLSDELALGLSPVSATPSQGTCSNARRRSRATSGRSPGQASATVTIVAMVTAQTPSAIVNSASVSSPDDSIARQQRLHPRS